MGRLVKESCFQELLLDVLMVIVPIGMGGMGETPQRLECEGPFS